MALGVAVSFFGLLAVSLVNPMIAAYVGAALLSLIFARLLFAWLH